MTIKPGFLSTAKLSRAASVGRETLRFYETRGLIKPVGRTTAGYRQYDPAVVDRIAFIKQTQLAGFTLKEIRQLLHLNSTGLDTCGELSKILQGKLQQVDEQLSQMQERRAALLTLVTSCSNQNQSRQCGFVGQGPGCC
jgi:MerR family copper efflux transcriptional regulator